MIRAIYQRLAAALHGQPTKAAGRDAYFKRRKNLKYYQEVRRRIDALSPGRLLIDVGAANTPIVSWGEFGRRIALDHVEWANKLPGVESVVADWLQYEAPEPASVVTCLQVLEHIDDGMVTPFARKLLTTGEHILVSVPYKWPKDQCKWHVQDPVDLAKLVSWMGKDPEDHAIIHDNRSRLIATFRGDV